MKLESSKERSWEGVAFVRAGLGDLDPVGGEIGGGFCFLSRCPSHFLCPQFSSVYIESPLCLALVVIILK